MQTTTDASQRTSDLVSASVEAFRSGDMDRLAQYYSPDAVWHLDGMSPFSGTYRGRDAVFDILQRIADATDGTLGVENIATMASDGYATAWNRLTGTRGYKVLDIFDALIFRLEGDLIAEVWERPEQPAFDDFIAD